MTRSCVHENMVGWDRVRLEMKNTDEGPHTGLYTARAREGHPWCLGTLCQRNPNQTWLGEKETRGLSRDRRVRRKQN